MMVVEERLKDEDEFVREWLKGENGVKEMKMVRMSLLYRQGGWSEPVDWSDSVMKLRMEIKEIESLLHSVIVVLRVCWG